MTRAEKDAIVVKFQGLPIHCAQVLCRRHPQWRAHWDDLLQAGSIGLIVAADKYRDDMGASYKTYAYFWVMHYIRTEAARHEARGYTGMTRRVGKPAKVLFEHALSAQGTIDGSLMDAEGENEFKKDGHALDQFLVEAPQHDLSEESQLRRAFLEFLRDTAGEYSARDRDILYRRLVQPDNSYESIAREVGLARQRVQQICGVLKAKFEEFVEMLRAEEAAIA